MAHDFIATSPSGMKVTLRKGDKCWEVILPSGRAMGKVDYSSATFLERGRDTATWLVPGGKELTLTDVRPDVSPLEEWERELLVDAARRFIRTDRCDGVIDSVAVKNIFLIAGWTRKETVTDEELEEVMEAAGYYLRSKVPWEFLPVSTS